MVAERRRARTKRSTLSTAALRGRLRGVAGELSYAEISRRTGANAETVRRVLTRDVPSVAFLAAFCVAFQVSADRLLFGRRGRHNQSALLEVANRALARIERLARGPLGSVQQARQRTPDARRILAGTDTALPIGV